MEKMPFHAGRGCGYALIGLQQPYPELFIGVAWGSDRVMDQNPRHPRPGKDQLRELRTIFDIDRPEDIDRLVASGTLPGWRDGSRLTHSNQARARYSTHATWIGLRRRDRNLMPARGAIRHEQRFLDGRADGWKERSSAMASMSRWFRPGSEGAAMPQQLVFDRLDMQSGTRRNVVSTLASAPNDFWWQWRAQRLGRDRRRSNGSGGIAFTRTNSSKSIACEADSRGRFGLRAPEFRLGGNGRRSSDIRHLDAASEGWRAATDAPFAAERSTSP